MTINGGCDAGGKLDALASLLVGLWPRVAPTAESAEWAVPGAMPECMTTARKRFGY
jgi:hypothetical protein